MTAHYDDLKNKTFLVTGASSGIGQAIAIALGAQGANVIITGRNQERLDATKQQIGKQASTHVADLTNTEARHQLVEALPQLDGICHAAGIIDPFPIRYLNEAVFERIFSINVIAPILLTSSALQKKKINEGASFVFLSSVSSSKAMKGGSLYCASKSAIEAFSRNITLEHAPKRIRSNCIKAGMVDTAMYQQAKEYVELGTLEEKRISYESQYPLGIGKTEDIASLCLFLLSSSSQWITGTSITADGGFTS